MLRWQWLRSGFLTGFGFNPLQATPLIAAPLWQLIVAMARTVRWGEAGQTKFWVAYAMRNKAFWSTMVFSM